MLKYNKEQNRQLEWRQKTYSALIKEQFLQLKLD